MPEQVLITVISFWGLRDLQANSYARDVINWLKNVPKGVLRSYEEYVIQYDISLSRMLDDIPIRDLLIPFETPNLSPSTFGIS